MSAPNLIEVTAHHGLGCFIDVWDTPGLGVSLNAGETRKRLADEDKGFLD